MDYSSIRGIKEHIRNTIVRANGSINYIMVCCASTLEELRYIDRKAVVVIEALFGNIPLSDNIIIEPKDIKNETINSKQKVPVWDGPYRKKPGEYS